MAVREYIGARYIPLFSDPIEWDNSNSYEPLTVVINEGNSYISKQYVPQGVDLPSTAERSNDYWLLWADFNAQVEQYRAEVAQFSERIEANEESIAAEVTAREEAITAEAQARIDADNALTSADSALSARIDANASNITTINNTMATLDSSIDLLQSKIDAPILLIVGDSWTYWSDNFITNWGAIIEARSPYKVISYGMGGTGWQHRGGTNAQIQGNFSEQVERAYANMTSDERSRVSAIVAIGGVNDFSANSYNIENTITAINNGASSYRDKCIQRFPQANIYGGINIQNITYSAGTTAVRNMHEVAHRCDKYTLPAQGVTPIKNLHWYMWTYQTATYKDPLHPNETGCTALAEMVLSTLTGAGIDAITGFQQRTFTADNGSSFTLSWDFINGHGNLIFSNFDPDKAVNAGYNSDSFTIPEAGWGVNYRILTLPLRYQPCTIMTSGVPYQFSSNTQFWTTWARIPSAGTLNFGNLIKPGRLYGGNLVYAVGES